MPRQVFVVYFLLLLFVCCQLCGQKCAAQAQEPQTKTDGKLIDEFLKPGDEEIKKNLQINKADDKVEHIDLVSLVAANDVIFAMAEVNYTDSTRSTDKNIAVLAKYFETTESSWCDQAFSGKGGKWIVKSGTEKLKDTSDKAVIKSFAVATKKNKIYHITISNSTFESSGLLEPSPAAKWHVKLAEGTVTDSVGGETTRKQINLKSSTIPLSKENENKLEQLGASLAEPPPSDGFAFITSDNNIFFFMKGKNKGGGNKNIVAVFKIEGSATLKLSPVDILEECYSSFFQWEGETIMAPGSCQDKNNQNVKVFKKQDKKFDDIDKPIARLRDFLKDKNNFTTAKIGDRNVLLCTQQKVVDGGTKKDVYLWMSDGTHVTNAGTIIEKIEGTFDGSVLYTNDELIALHQKYNTGDGKGGEKVKNTFSLTRLKEQLEKVKFFLDEWKKSNETVSKLCESTRNTSIHCRTSPPIAGLVGFLRETTDGTSGNIKIIWKDMYYYSNVTVENGEKVNKVPNGLKFGGEGEGQNG